MTQSAGPSDQASRASALRKARVLSRRGKHGEAIRLLQPIIEDGSANAETHGLFGSILSRSGDATGAERALRRAVELAPDVAKLRAELAAFLIQHEIQHERRDEASVILRELVSSNSIDPDTNHMVGRLLFWELGDTDNAETALHKAVTSDPSASEIRLTTMQE